MKLFFTETQLAHQPKQYMVHGLIVDPFENPNRATTLIASLESVGLQRAEPRDFGRDPILKVHADHYVAFLEEAYARFMELPDHGPEVLPNVHPYRGASRAYADRGPPRARSYGPQSRQWPRLPSLSGSKPRLVRRSRCRLGRRPEPTLCRRKS